MTDFGGSGKHGLTCIQTCTTGLLDLLDFGATLANAIKSIQLIDRVRLTVAYTLPMRELGMMNLMVTAREPGTEATSNGSSLMRLTMRPKACTGVSTKHSSNFQLTLATESRGPETLRIRSGLPGMDSETVTRALDLDCATGDDQQAEHVTDRERLTRISLTWAPPLPMMMLAS